MTIKEADKKYNFIQVELEQSSNIKAVWYDEMAEVLKIEFYNATMYLYYNIDFDTINKWKWAESVGAYFAEHIKWAEYEKLED